MSTSAESGGERGPRSCGAFSHGRSIAHLRYYSVRGDAGELRHRRDAGGRRAAWHRAHRAGEGRQAARLSHRQLFGPARQLPAGDVGAARDRRRFYRAQAPAHRREGAVPGRLLLSYRRHRQRPLLCHGRGLSLPARGGGRASVVGAGAVRRRGVKVATWRGGPRFTVDDVAEPVAGPGQVLVEVHTAGICGTDLHATQGLFPWSPPLVMGHEYTGVVRDVGRGVKKNLVGRAVACEPSYGCGACAECEAGRVSQCPRCTRVGGFAERVALPLHCVHPLPRGLDPVTAAMTEPAACCLAGLEQLRPPRGATVLVIGAGIMGLLTMVLARRRGARRLIVSDPIEERREFARRLGAAVTIDPT